jgi:hypothetical protein
MLIIDIVDHIQTGFGLRMSGGARESRHTHRQHHAFLQAVLQQCANEVGLY